MITLSVAALRNMFPGVIASIIVAIAAVFLNEHYGAPAMLFALLLGLSFKFLSEEGRCVGGIVMASTAILRVGVALLGFRITVDQMMALGPWTILFIAASVAAIIAIGLLLSRLLNLDWRILCDGACRWARFEVKLDPQLPQKLLPLSIDRKWMNAKAGMEAGLGQGTHKG